jgi:hypothetical protein
MDLGSQSKRISWFYLLTFSLIFGVMLSLDGSLVVKTASALDCDFLDVNVDDTGD